MSGGGGNCPGQPILGGGNNMNLTVGAQIVKTLLLFFNNTIVIYHLMLNLMQNKVDKNNVGISQFFQKL